MNPIAPVVVVSQAGGQVLYGTTQNGGTAGDGTAFKLDATNTLTLLHNFGDVAYPNDGQTPMAGLTLGPDGNLYGTTMAGGTGSGTVFAIAGNLAGPPPTGFPETYWILTGTLPPGMSFDSTSGTITGTPLPGDPIGAFNVTITYVSNGQPGTPQNISIDLAQPFATWAAGYSLPVNGTPPGGPATPPDGVPNLLKYLCDINPSQPLTPADRAMLPTPGIVTSGGSDYLTLSYCQYAGMTGLTVTLQTSTDMVNWTDVPPANLLNQQMGTTSNGDTMVLQGSKLSGTAKQFIRLNVTSQ